MKSAITKTFLRSFSRRVKQGTGFAAQVLFIFSLIFMGCDTNGDKDDANNNNTGGGTVSYESFSPPSIFVETGVNKKLISFKSSVSPNNLISGIPAYATNHGLKKDPKLFNATGDFPLVLITEEEYLKNQANLAAAPIYATIYAFYNNEATNNNVFKISAKAGGSGRITLNNPTNWNIEIRQDGPTGQVLGYVASQMTNTVLRVDSPGDYALYPVFKRYLATEKEIYEVVPKYTSGALEGKPYAKDFALSGDGTASWNLAEVAEKINFSLSSGSFYLRITNNSNTAVRFTRGDTELVTSMGIKGVAPANTNVYSIKIQRNVDGTYPNQETISQLKIGTLQNALPIPEQAYKLDYVYTLRISGADASNLQLGTVEEGQKMDLDKIFGYN